MRQPTQPQQPKIYAAIIGKNEEQSLPRCLASLKDFDGIYYTDTGSTDRSVELAKKAGAKVSFRKWDHDFSKARNFNLDQIPKDEWVFIIDCDEFLEVGAIKKIRAAMAKSKTGHVFAHVKNVNDGGEHEHLRFFKNNIRYKDAWHTHIPVKTFEFSDVVLYHKPSVNHKKNPQRNWEIIKRMRHKTPRMKAMIARELMGLQKYKEALRYYREYLKDAEYNQQTADALVYAGQCFFQLGKINEAQANILEAIKFNPEFKEALIAMATTCPPWQMKAWLRFAKGATNERIINIPGRQDERIADLEQVAQLVQKGVKLKEIQKILSKKK